MRLLVRCAFQHGRRLALLIVTFIFMLFLTLSTQMEMLSVGVLTSSGADFFTMFESDESGVHRESIEKNWDEIDRDHKGVITKTDVHRYMAKQRDRNPLNTAMRWFSQRIDWHSNLQLLAVFLIFVAVLKGVSLFGSQYTKQLVMIRVSRDLRHQYFRHIHTLSMPFYQKYDAGSLSSRIYADALQVSEAIYAAMTTYIQTPFAVISTLCMCFYVSAKLSLLTFIAFPIIFAPILYFARKVKGVARRVLRSTEGFFSAMIDSISGMQTIKLFNMERHSQNRFSSQNDRVAKLEEKGARFGFAARPVLHISSTCLLAAIILFGLYWAEMTISEILIFCGLVYLMYDPIKKLNDENIRIQKGIAAAERMYEVLELKPDIADVLGAVDAETFDSEIVFDDVWFRYDKEWILKGVSFTVKKGEVVAVVGPTGAGKSTIAQLLPRLYEPQDGEIRLDGKPLQSLTQRSLRALAAFVPQRPFMFIDTVAENIRFGGDFTDEEVQDAARRAHADEFIQNLPQGYHTPVVSGGTNLSGGQQQRIAIARALVRRAPILVLDEATSALDAVSENYIKLAMVELRGQITQIVIAHRLSTVEHADKIIFLEDGKLTAQGSKDELLESCPAFREMWELMQGPAAAPS